MPMSKGQMLDIDPEDVLDGGLYSLSLRCALIIAVGM